MDKNFDHLKYQEELKKYWSKEKTYDRNKHAGPLYSIDTPPPTVSGSLHIGHIFSYTHTDIIARYKRLSGYSVFYPFGFDDNGLPTERFVEKKHNISAHYIKRSDFIKLCEEETKTTEKEFENLWQTMGLSVDWNSCYSTISAPVRKISQESFIRLFEKGFVYRKEEPALYCTTCRTSIAQADLDDLEVATTFNDIQFTSKDGEKLIIGTTRPELLPSCAALLFNPEDKRYQHLKGKTAIVPVFENEVPILEDENVDIEKGTGLVMCCTFGDKTDIEWYKKFKLPYRQSIGLDGKWLESTGPLAGLRAVNARTKILEILEEKGLLLNKKPIKHSVGIHDRCKKEIEYLAINQWFLKIIEHKDEFIKLADKIKWSPNFMKSRYINWVENLNWDWCLSRQRFFGIPFPVWHCLNCNKVILAPINSLPIDPQEQKFEKCPFCSSSNIEPEKDIMDTWNTSSLTPQICFGLFNKDAKSSFTEDIKKFMPMSMRPQAHDIIRTWAFYTIIKSWFHNQNIPWEEIVISGHVLSGEKEKISKSKGNANLTPQGLLESFPADAIRFWTAAGGLGYDIAFSESQLKIGQKLVTKIWNAFRFCKEHIDEYQPTKAPHNLGLVNEWILDRAANIFETYNKDLEKNEFGLALTHLEKFFWSDFCDNYLELIKDQMFNPSEYPAEEINATRYTLYSVGLSILQMYAPYIPYVTEAIYQDLYKSKVQVDSIHQTKFKDVQTSSKFPQSSANIKVVLDIIDQVRKLKSENNLSLKTDLAKIILHAVSPENTKIIKQEEKLIKGISKASLIGFSNDQLETPTMEQMDKTWIAKL
ncbi:MAG: Valine-tRNA ligase [candidate division TM6 bacterium GW2011_GWF2_32_72]|nr:MAG: Valine-tRNA ligase [candidate division TM6 bacterium GW2011_GWF2_32_72]